MSALEYVSWNWPGLLLVASVTVGVPVVLVARRGR
jgi:hypothetical protein